jgi:hypothetical protein
LKSHRLNGIRTKLLIATLFVFCACGISYADNYASFAGELGKSNNSLRVNEKNYSLDEQDFVNQMYIKNMDIFELMVDIDRLASLKKSLDEKEDVIKDPIIKIKLDEILNVRCLGINWRSNEFEPFIKSGLSKIKNGLIAFEAAKQIDIINRIRSYSNNQLKEVGYDCREN